ncbi:hypothetical protein U1Q18_023342, partial [Sarracenia purpurea var. burkii]
RGVTGLAGLVRLACSTDLLHQPVWCRHGKDFSLFGRTGPWSVIVPWSILGAQPPLAGETRFGSPGRGWARVTKHSSPTCVDARPMEL